MPELPDWIQPGERVAIRGDNYSGFHYDMDAVDYITKTQIVLTNGRRFRVNGLVEVGSGRGTLVDRNDEAVKHYRIRKQIESFARKVEEIGRQVRNDVQLHPDDALNQIGAAQRQMEKMICRIREDKFS